MTRFSRADALHLLAAIRVFHQPQDTSDVTANGWSIALSQAGISSRDDAVQAAVTHYTTPGMDKWITPADVVAGVRRIRRARLEHSGQIVPDVDPDDVPAWLAARRAGLKALADGTVTALPPSPGQVDPRVAAAIPGLLKRPPRPAAITAEGGQKPRKAAPPAPTVTPAATAEMEAERARQLRALEEAHGVGA